MKKWLLIVMAGLMLIGCSAGNSASSSRRSLMLIDIREQPRNAKLSSSKYQARLKKSQKQHRRENQRSYHRASR
jgi:hypothetical protein